MNPKATAHAEEAERLLAESVKHKVQSARGQLAALQAGAHASLAVFYALPGDAPDA